MIECLVLTASPATELKFNYSKCNDYQVAYGTLDDYRSQPGRYDCIVVSMCDGFLNWPRWHLQDLARQLRLGGHLIVAGNPYGDQSTLSTTSKLKRTAKRLLWNMRWKLTHSRLAARLPNPTLIRIAEQRGFKIDHNRDTAVKYDFALSSTLATPPLFPGEPRTYLKKSTAVDEEQADLPENAAILHKHFPDWFHNNHASIEDRDLKKLNLAERLPETGPANVLVIAPHPDDELIGCGGSLLRLQSLGACIHILHMTEGMHCLALRTTSNDIARSTRWKEAQQVANELCFETTYWETGSSGALEYNNENIANLHNILIKLKPSIIFLPSADDKHREHRIAHQIFLAADKEYARQKTCLCYPTWGNMPQANAICDVSDVYPKIIDTLYLYKTAMKAEDYATRCRLFTRFCGKLIGTNAAEVFYILQSSFEHSDAK